MHEILGFSDLWAAGVWSCYLSTALLPWPPRLPPRQLPPSPAPSCRKKGQDNEGAVCTGASPSLAPQTYTLQVPVLCCLLCPFSCVISPLVPYKGFHLIIDTFVNKIISVLIIWTFKINLKTCFLVLSHASSASLLSMVIWQHLQPLSGLIRLFWATCLTTIYNFVSMEKYASEDITNGSVTYNHLSFKLPLYLLFPFFFNWN